MEQEKEFTSEYEKQYASGFSQGYLLSAHEPELASQLPKFDKTQSPYLKGLSNGVTQQQKRREFLANLAKTRNAEHTATSKPRRR